MQEENPATKDTDFLAQSLSKKESAVARLTPKSGQHTALVTGSPVHGGDPALSTALHGLPGVALRH